MMDNPFAAWCLAFGAVLAADFSWAVYIRAVKEAMVLRACFWSVLIYLTGAVAVIGFVHDPWLLIPSCAGAACGTWLGMLFPQPEEAEEG